MTVIFYTNYFFFQAEDGIRDRNVTGVQTCALPIFYHPRPGVGGRCIRRRPAACHALDFARRTPRHPRSEERRVGKECRSRGGTCHEKKKRRVLRAKHNTENQNWRRAAIVVVVSLFY